MELAPMWLRPPMRTTPPRKTMEEIAAFANQPVVIDNVREA
jgi:hypothetical protein